MSETISIPAVGQRCRPRVFGPIRWIDFVKYQGACGDFHPLQHDELFAKQSRVPSVFSVSMLQAGLLATYATDWLGADTIRRYALRFQEQCWPGDVLKCDGVVTEVKPDENGMHRVTVELTCTRQSGGVAIAATAEFLLPS